VDGDWWVLAVRPGVGAAADPHGVLFALDGAPRPRVDAEALRTLLNRVWTVYDTPRVFGPGAGPRRAPFGRYAAAVRFLHPLPAVALLNAAVVAAGAGGSGNVAVLNPVAVGDAYAAAPEAAPLVKVIARAEVARATGSVEGRGPR
jgi:hypothetical protein